jgi:LuxR family transcriptional regulator, maltose regulon positive regulatory protein
MGIVSVLMSDLLRDGNDLSAAVRLSIESLRALREYREAPPLVLLASLSSTWLQLARPAPDGGGCEACRGDSASRPDRANCSAWRACWAPPSHQVRLAVGDAAAAVAWAAAAPPIPLAAIVADGGQMLAAGLEPMGVAAQILAAQGSATGDAALSRERDDVSSPRRNWQRGQAWAG